MKACINNVGSGVSAGPLDRVQGFLYNCSLATTSAAAIHASRIRTLAILIGTLPE